MALGWAGLFEALLFDAASILGEVPMGTVEVYTRMIGIIVAVVGIAVILILQGSGARDWYDHLERMRRGQ